MTIQSIALATKHSQDSALRYYTFYLLNGQRKVFLGVDPQDAYTNNQSYADGQQAIMLIDKGITDNFLWKDNQWVKKEAYNLGVLLNDLSQDTSIIDIGPDLLKQHDELYYEFENQDRVFIQYRWANFLQGWTKLIQIFYGEYQAGNYGDYNNSIPQEGSYLCNQLEYYSLDNAAAALNRFVEIISSGLVHGVGDSKRESVEEIRSKQYPDIIYTDLNNQQQVVLLGSLIKRLEMHESIGHFIKKGFIRRPEVEEHAVLHEMYEHIMYYCDRYLITSDGQRDSGNEGILTKLFGYQFTPGETDAFGPLSMVIRTTVGKLVYC